MKKEIFLFFLRTLAYPFKLLLKLILKGIKERL